MPPLFSINTILKIKHSLLSTLKKVFSFSFWLNAIRLFFISFRREGKYIIVFKRKFDVSSFIPYTPVVSIVGFVVIGYLISGGSLSLATTDFVVWDEAVVASAIEGIDPYTPLVEEKKTVFLATLKKEVEKPQLALTEGGIYIGPQTTSIKVETPAEKEERKEVIEYRVQSGDTLSAIAQKFGLKIDTLKWANNISNVDQIKPGQVLKIPPTDGVLYTVRRGDTLLAIVQKYKGDLQKTLAVNGLEDASKIYEGQKILIAGGKITVSRSYTASNSRSTTSTSRSSNTTARYVPRGSYPNRFPYGWCTWYVASRRYIPWSGHARTWYWQAKSYGYAVGSTPRPGAIVVMRESWWGHVAIVEAVYGSSFLISEMNGVAGWGRVGRRVIPNNYSAIIGFIY